MWLEAGAGTEGQSRLLSVEGELGSLVLGLEAVAQRLVGEQAGSMWMSRLRLEWWLLVSL